MAARFNISGYRILEQLYAGTRTLVYRGICESNQQPVVVKLLRNELPSFSELAQFRNQYTIMRSIADANAKTLSLPGIIQPYSLKPYRNSYALVMEDFGGVSLSQYVRQKAGTGIIRSQQSGVSSQQSGQNPSPTHPPIHPSLSVSEFLSIALQLCDILAELYCHRVIHKDIKPANILINPDTQQVKLIDFSIASLLPRETQEMQSPNGLEGTLAYLSPEQTGRMNRGIDYRSDYYSLGVTFFELLTGQLPFQSTDPIELVHCHIARQPPALHSLNPAIPPVLSAIVGKLMAKTAEDRYQNIQGLKHDLEHCLHSLQATGQILPFAIGQHDRTDRFTIPEKLYGREAEVQALLDAFDRVSGMDGWVDGEDRGDGGDGGGGEDASQLHLSPSSPSFTHPLIHSSTHPPIHPSTSLSRSELILIAGFSGIGKTAVVNEVHKPIARGARIANVRQRGYFIKGKYDQFQRNIPFSALVQAFRELMAQLLSESDAQLAAWKQNILAALGETGQVMIEVIPELEQVIGRQPPVPQLAGDAAQNRFNRLFLQFIRVFAQPEHPLVIFIDDLQWADSASLKLMQLLMSAADTRHLLLIGAYRDNEVTPAHPLMLTLEQLHKAGTLINTLTLAPLAQSSVNQLVADTLSCSLVLASPLTDLIMGKTQGNPFFTTQFLKALHQDGLITFNRDGNYWQCDVVQVRSLALSQDVVEFMTLQLQKLPPETQQVLTLAACIGNQFDLATLAIVHGKSATETSADLWKALQEGLILPQSEIYKFYQEAGGRSKNSEEQSNSPASWLLTPASCFYKFLHDRVQQAADSLIPDDQKQAMHLKIGQQLLSNISETEQEERIFDIVNHLNLGSGLLTAEAQRNQLAELNLKAGRRAIVSTAYAAAAQYFETGIQLLPIDSWQHQYRLTLSLYELAVEAEYCSINFTRAQTLIDVVLQQTTHLLDRIKVFELQIQIYMAQTEMPQAVAVGISTLALLGINLDHAPSAQDIQFPTLAEVESLSPMTDTTALATMRILMAIMPSVYITQPERMPSIVLSMIDLSLKQGYTAITAYAYVFYGLLLCGLERQIDRGYEVGWLGLKILERFPARELECRVINLFDVFIRPWKQPLIDTVESLTIASQVGFETGDVEYASYATTHSCMHCFLAGVALEEVQKKQAIALESLLKTKQDYSIHNAKIWQQGVANLLGQAANPSQLQGQNFDQTELLPLFHASNNRTLLFTAYVAKQMLSYLFGQYEAAVTDAENACNDADAAIGYATVTIHNFYYSLALLAEFDRLTALGKQQSLLDQVEANQGLMAEWMTHAPANFAHKYDLIEAEKARVLNHKVLATDLYDRAIVGARQYSYVQEEALANELAARFYLDWGKQRLAQEYLVEAYYCYARWGAIAKVQDLEQRYSQLLAPVLRQRQLSLTATETIFFPSPHTSQPSSSSISGTLDLAAILKASQALSSEIQLDQLVFALLEVVIESAGAEKAALMLLQDQHLRLTAINYAESCSQKLFAIPVEDSQDVPVSLVNRVKRSLEPAVIMDATQHPLLASDPYIQQNQCRSVLCMPILHQGNLLGVLYLENNLATGVFTNDRVELLNLLCSQAAISLENARLYQQSQQALQTLQRTQTQMIQSEKMSGLGQLVAGVAHEINNPVNFIFGNLSHANSYTQDLLGLLHLYQQHYPIPHAEIQQEAEAIDLDFLLEDLPRLLYSMRVGAERIQKIVASLRTFSRMDEAEVKSVNIHDGIDSTLMILQHRLKARPEHSGIEVSKEYGNLPLVECYAGQLNQVFMNVLSNAIDALEDRLEQQREFQPAITIQTQPCEHNSVCIQIADNGLGIAAAIQSKLFDPFFTTKPVGKGTGMGLSISHQIVTEKHNGTLHCISAPGQGTTFMITIPARSS